MKKIFLAGILLLLPVLVLGQGTQIQQTTVANLPNPPNHPNTVFMVTDGASVSDCSVGGGTTIVLCIWNGSSWGAGGVAVPASVNVLGSNSGGSLIASTATNIEAPRLATSSGSANAYVLTLTPAITTYTGFCGEFIANFSNTAAATININGLGGVAITKNGASLTPLISNDIKTGQVVGLCYDGTEMQMQSQFANGPGIGFGIDPSSPAFGAKFDARWTADGAITNNSPTVTSNTINFTQADVGKKIYTIASATGLTHLNSTVLSVQSSTSATANANATATESGSGLILGTDDTTALVAAWTAAINNNKLLLLPGGATIATGQLFAATGNSFARGTAFSVFGSSPGTIIIIAPDFNFAGCTGGSGGCIWGVTTQQFVFPDAIHSWPQVGNFSVSGMSSAFVSAANATLFSSGSNGGGVYHDIVVNGFCPNGSGMTIFQLNTEDRLINPNIQGNACPTSNIAVGINVTGSNVEIVNPIVAYMNKQGIIFNNTFGGTNVHGGLFTNLGITGSVGYASLTNSTDINFFGTYFNSSGGNQIGIKVDGTSSVNLIGVKCVTLASTGAGCLSVAAGGIAYIGRHTQLSNGGAPSFSISNSGTVFDDGTNTFGSAPTGTVPTCAMTTGGGTGPACTVLAGSSNEKGTVEMTPGTTPGSTGTTTITFAGTFAGATNTTPSCVFTLANTGTGAWNALGTVFFSTRSTTVPVFTWADNAVALTAASTYDVDYKCTPR